MKKKLSLCYSIVYYYNGAQRYKQVGRPYGVLILLGLVPCVPSALVSSVFMVILLTSFSLPFRDLSLVGSTLDVVD